jgi:hypothetical protein
MAHSLRWLRKTPDESVDESMNESMADRWIDHRLEALS